MSAERKINGTTYRVDPVLATKALPLFFRLGKVLGPGFDAMLSALLSRAQDEEAFGAKMLVAIADVLGAADPDASTALIGEVVGLAKVKRPSWAYEAATLDEDMTERPEDLIPVIGFVLETTFGPLVGSVAKMAGAARAT